MVRGVTAKLYVDPQARPKFYRPQSVPYAMREKELDRLHQQGIIEPVQFSDWAAPIVPILKQGGSVRICGDYNLTVSAVTKLDTYPLPHIDDCLHHCQVENTFPNLIWLKPTYNYPWTRLQENM